MSHPSCFILPNFLVQEYIKDLERAEQSNLSVANITGHLPAGAAEALPTPRELIDRLKAHLALQKGIAASLSLGATQARAAFAALPHHEAAPFFATAAGPLRSGAAPGIPEEPEQQIYNMGTKTDSRYSEEYVPPAEDQRLPGDPVEPSFDADATAVFENTRTVYKFYRAIFNRDSLDNKHMKLVSSIHFGKKYANAFWTDLDSQMVYGDGSPEILFNITTSLDVAGHEMTHGFINKAAGLEYNAESGALNESIADIFGVLTKQWHLKQTASTADWLVGPNTVPFGKALRTFKADEPANKYDFQPKNVARMRELQNNPRFYDYIKEDNGGVHIFSGIPNHAFYLFATAFGPDSKAYEVPGHVWYDTVVSRKVDSNSSFLEFAKLTLEVARTRGDDVEKKLLAAWKTVGVLAN